MALVGLLLTACGADGDGPRDNAAPTDIQDAAAVDAGGTEESMDDTTDAGEGSAPVPDAGETGPVIPPAPDYPLDDQLRVDEITMKCTHNSYHIEPEFPADPSHRYTHLPLDQQLALQGVRAFELDIHAGEEFPVYHIPLGIDDVSNCPTLAACLSGVRSWSVVNPGHHLVVVWVEIKDELDRDTITDYDALDAAVRGSLGDRLYTPDDFLRGFPNQRAALEALGWPTLGETRDRVLVVILDNDEPHQGGYTREFTSLDGRAMFVRASEDQYDLPWAVIAKINNPADSEAIAAAHEAGMLIASNTGSAGQSVEDAQARRQAGITNGVHMLCDDFVGPEGGQPIWLTLPGGQPSMCSTVRGSEACTPADVESLAAFVP